MCLHFENLVGDAHTSRANYTTTEQREWRACVHDRREKKIPASLFTVACSLIWSLVICQETLYTHNKTENEDIDRVKRANKCRAISSPELVRWRYDVPVTFPLNVLNSSLACSVNQAFGGNWKQLIRCSTFIDHQSKCSREMNVVSLRK